MQQIYEYPVLSQFLAVTPIDIYYTHFCWFVRRWQTEKTASGFHGKVWPTEKPSVMALCQEAHMTLEYEVLQTLAERVLMLLPVTCARVGCPDTRWSEPDHIVVPRPCQPFFGRVVVRSCQVSDQLFDQGQGLVAVPGILMIEQESVV